GRCGGGDGGVAQLFAVTALGREWFPNPRRVAPPGAAHHAGTVDGRGEEGDAAADSRRREHGLHGRCDRRAELAGAEPVGRSRGGGGAPRRYRGDCNPNGAAAESGWVAV